MRRPQTLTTRVASTLAVVAVSLIGAGAANAAFVPAGSASPITPEATIVGSLKGQPCVCGPVGFALTN